MKDQDYVREAIGLADGWRIINVPDVGEMADTPIDSANYHSIELMDYSIKDALAAQLVRQVDALETYFMVTTPLVSKVYESLSSINERIIAEARNNDRTMNTIKAIVDSKVLE